MGSILRGINDLVDQHLGITHIGKTPHHKHKESWMHLGKTGTPPVDWPELVAAMADRIEANWDGKKCRGGRNWRSEKQPHVSADNTGEKVLEKGIQEYCGPEWTNQVPICSGVNDANDGKRSVDLAHLDGDRLELIELKITSDTPLYAAIEVLIYGLVYCFSRTHRDQLGYTLARNPVVFTPSKVELKVLAPTNFYGSGNEITLRAIEEGISTGLAQLPMDGYGLTFAFEQFEPKPVLPNPGSKAASRAAIDERVRVLP